MQDGRFCREKRLRGGLSYFFAILCFISPSGRGASGCCMQRCDLKEATKCSESSIQCFFFYHVLPIMLLLSRAPESPTLPSHPHPLLLPRPASLSLSILLLILTLQVAAKSVTSRRRPSVRSPSIQVLSIFDLPRFGSSSAAPFPHPPNNTRLPQSISPTSSRSCSNPLPFSHRCSLLLLLFPCACVPPSLPPLAPPRLASSLGHAPSCRASLLML